MEPEDFGEVRRVVIALAMKLRMGMDYFCGLPFLEVLEIMKEVAELVKKKRIQDGDKNRRRD